MKDTHVLNHEDLDHIWHQVPPNYYQNGVRKNILQRAWHTRKLKTVLGLMNNTHKNILDVGCASGWFLSQVAKHYPNAKCVGVDVYKNAIEYGKKHYKNIKFTWADGHKLPFNNNSFDAVICTEVLEHVVDPEEVLGEIKRVLTPEGVAVIEMDTGNFMFSAVWYWWTHLRRGVWRDAHIHSFNAKKLERLIIKSGFKITKKKIFNYSMAVAFKLQK